LIHELQCFPFLEPSRLILVSELLLEQVGCPMFSARVTSELRPWGLAEGPAFQEGFRFEQEARPGTDCDIFAGSVQHISVVGTNPKAYDQIGREANHPGVAAVVAQAWVASERKAEAQVADSMCSTALHHSLKESRYDRCHAWIDRSARVWHRSFQPIASGTSDSIE